MGTIVLIEVRPQGLPAEQTRAAVADACAVLHRADEIFSLYRADTPLSRLRRGEIELGDCPPEVSEVEQLCREAVLSSDGWFDPWKVPGGFDPTGLVKGWAAREAARRLQSAGAGAAMVNAAGDIACFGTPGGQDAWRVGIRTPEAADQLLCVIDLDGAVATSGNYERGAHVWDVRGGVPAEKIASASVTGPDLALADALATGLFAAGAEGLGAVERAGYQGIVALHDGTCLTTPGFQDLLAV